jgi:hypothetical protein
MPNKHNADRRHHFGKMKFKVRNWASYEALMALIVAIGYRSGV